MLVGSTLTILYLFGRASSIALPQEGNSFQLKRTDSMDSQQDEATYPSWLSKRSGEIEPLTPEEIKQVKEEFDFDCSLFSNGVQITTADWLYGAALSIASKTGRHEITGWTAEGTITVGPDLKDPQKFAPCTPIHCLSKNNEGVLQLCGKNPFKYGFGISTEVLGRLLIIHAQICDYANKPNRAVPQFEITSKSNLQKGMSIRLHQGSCNDLVAEECKKSDDYSKSKCLAQKRLYGIEWTDEGAKTSGK